MILSESHSSSKFVYEYKCDNFILKYLHERDHFHEILRWMQEVFLPQGYPESVSSDYIKYQIWDTIQALSSTITSTIATQAVFRGYGVGRSEATVMAASVTWIYKTGTGLIGKILFAYWKGVFLDSDCKRWRLVADIANDACIFIQIFSSLLPSVFFKPLICLTSIGESVVGVAGGCTRAAMTQHLARRNNMADVSAKDGSQECLSNLIGLVLNLIVVRLVTDNIFLTMLMLFLLTGVHLYSNYRAVRSLHMCSFNQSRLHYVLQEWFLTCQTRLMSVKTANEKEPVLRNFNRYHISDVKIGISVNQLDSLWLLQFFQVNEIFKNENYILLLNLPKSSSKYNKFLGGQIHILLKQGAQPIDQLKSLFQVEILEYWCYGNKSIEVYDKYFMNGMQELWPEQYVFNNIKDLEIHAITKSLERMNDLFDDFIKLLSKDNLSNNTNSRWVLSPLLLGADEWRLHGITKCE